MLLKLFEKELSEDFTTEWLHLDIKQGNSKLKPHTLCVVWENVSGAMKGSLQILGSADSKLECVGVTIPIDKPTNKEDCSVYFLTSFIRYIKFKYNKNGTSAGVLSCFLELKQ
jgi:hypothetical protein